MQYRLLFAALAATISLVLAQKAPDCNAFDKTCPSNKGTTKGHINYDLTQASALNEWTALGGAVVTGPDGAEFTIHKQGDAPTIVTDYYIFYGEVSVEMKASPGTGIVSSVYMLSDDNDEIDWEALGGSIDKIQTDYFGKGDTSEDYNRWTWQPVMTPQEVLHKYTWIWSKEKMSWAIDGTVVRTVDYADAKGGTRFPQTPMRVRIGIWAGGDPNRIKGTIDWAGGETDFSKAPFTMYVKSVEIVNYTPAESYVYPDKSGSADSIEINGGVSSGETSSSTSFGTSATTDTASLTSSSTVLSTTASSSASQNEISISSTVTSISSPMDVSSSLWSSGLFGGTTISSSSGNILPTTSSAEPKSTVLRSNSTSAASSVTTASSTSKSSTGTVGDELLQLRLSPGSGYLPLLTLIVGFIQMRNWVLSRCLGIVQGIFGSGVLIWIPYP
ncbi:Concanavalin A-like lectin/glucanases superfamily [Penicillium samsonianum]|uniref:Concanavalin A-like lectin/glucanases superfamily n=1 Tax=Penicillium samsonianum TaxID=1882272 RepID=UPI0025486982|nr:Concanavalin A-like lectin/glucanases superfamily [Penicillium samsonianum]KAJ6127830.1 Concanavalin A-like lectin/glucanases superfamily [Penicillium samsonianum]